MLGTHSLGVFAATVFVVNATPGVDMMLTLTRTLRHGVVGGLVTALGVIAGCVVHTLVAAFGLAALLAASAHGVRARQVGRRRVPRLARHRHAARERVARRSRRRGRDRARRQPGPLARSSAKAC